MSLAADLVPEPQGAEDAADRCRWLLYNVWCKVWFDEVDDGLEPSRRAPWDEEGEDDVAKGRFVPHDEGGEQYEKKIAEM